MGLNMSKSPTDDRFLARCLTALILLCAPRVALCQRTLGVDEVVREALGRPEVAARFDAQISTARAALDERVVLPTPSFGLTHEQVVGDLNVGYLELSATVEQRFDWSGWREALRSALPHQTSALEAERAQWALDASSAVRSAFFQVRYHEARCGALSAWIERLGRGLEGLRAREARGDVSVYHRRRVEREIELAQARYAAARSELAEAWAGLERWISWDQRPQLVGDLRPAPPSDQAAPSGRPELARLRHLGLALDAEAEAWGAPLWRDWTVGAGYRYAEVGESTGHGVLLSLSLPITLWNTDEPRVRRLRSQRLAVRSELTLRAARASREVEAARQRLVESLSALDALSPPEEDAALSRLAQVAFDAGEASLTELLDAFESETNLQLARLDLLWAARRAAIELDRSRGVGAPR